jgi:nucleoside-diphosphate-sugar epimerase
MSGSSTHGCIVLGASGFIGRVVLDALKLEYPNVIGITRDEVDFNDKTTFNHLPLFDHTTIVDAVSRIDGSESDIYSVNVNGVEGLLNYWKDSGKEFNYNYFSTVSTLTPQVYKDNSYVMSKVMAENLIRKNCKRYSIIRLIFPFGPGERPNRLISRLISKAREGATIEVDALHLNLTPVSAFQENVSGADRFFKAHFAWRPPGVLTPSWGQKPPI